MDLAGREFNRSSRDMVFRNNIFATRHVAIGSEESGGISNITITNCTFGERNETGQRNS